MLPQARDMVNVDCGVSRCAVRSERIAADFVGGFAVFRALRSARLRCAGGTQMRAFENKQNPQQKRTRQALVERASCAERRGTSFY